MLHMAGVTGSVDINKKDGIAHPNPTNPSLPFTRLPLFSLHVFVLDHHHHVARHVCRWICRCCEYRRRCQRGARVVSAWRRENPIKLDAFLLMLERVFSLLSPPFLPPRLSTSLSETAPTSRTPSTLPMSPRRSTTSSSLPVSTPLYAPINNSTAVWLDTSGRAK